MEWSSVLGWVLTIAVFAVPAAMLLFFGAMIAIFPWAVAASAVLHITGYDSNIPSTPVPHTVVVEA